ncbi:MAG: tripartite tricarboxylate transporter substrate binding protein [Pseudomonadota bacterium]
MKYLLPGCAAIILAAGSAFAEYPEKSISVLVPFNAGSGPDSSFRMLQPEMEKLLGQPMVVLNVGGAGGTVGASQFAAEPKEGYNLAFMPVGTTTTQPHLRKVSYDDTSFEPICMTIQDPMGVSVSPDAGIDTIDALVDKAKAGTVTSGGPPPGSLPHIGQAAVAAAYDIEFKYVPHEGGGAAAKSILGGQVDVLVDPVGSILNYGLKPLVVLNGERLPAAPDVPTIDEVGGKPLRYSIWFGLFAPAGTPEDVLNKLDEACKEATSTESYKATVEKSGRTPRFMDRAEFSEFFKQQYKDNASLLTAVGLKK